MSELTFTGTVTKVGQTETFGEKGFRKRILVVTDGHDEYPQYVPFEFVQDNTEKLDSVNEGDEVTVTFNLRGNEWKDKFYASLQGWKIEVAGGKNTPKPTPAKAKATPQEAVFEAESDDDSDLPF